MAFQNLRYDDIRLDFSEKRRYSNDEIVSLIKAHNNSIQGWSFTDESEPKVNNNNFIKNFELVDTKTERFLITTSLRFYVNRNITKVIFKNKDKSNIKEFNCDYFERVLIGKMHENHINNEISEDGDETFDWHGISITVYKGIEDNSWYLYYKSKNNKNIRVRAIVDDDGNVEIYIGKEIQEDLGVLKHFDIEVEDTENGDDIYLYEISIASDVSKSFLINGEPAYKEISYFGYDTKNKLKKEDTFSAVTTEDNTFVNIISGDNFGVYSVPGFGVNGFQLSGFGGKSFIVPNQYKDSGATSPSTLHSHFSYNTQDNKTSADNKDGLSISATAKTELTEKWNFTQYPNLVFDGITNPIGISTATEICLDNEIIVCVDGAIYIGVKDKNDDVIKFKLNRTNYSSYENNITQIAPNYDWNDYSSHEGFWTFFTSFNQNITFNGYQSIDNIEAFDVKNQKNISLSPLMKALWKTEQYTETSNKKIGTILVRGSRGEGIYTGSIFNDEEDGEDEFIKKYITIIDRDINGSTGSATYGAVSGSPDSYISNSNHQLQIRTMEIGGTNFMLPEYWMSPDNSGNNKISPVFDDGSFVWDCDFMKFIAFSASVTINSTKISWMNNPQNKKELKQNNINFKFEPNALYPTTTSGDVTKNLKLENASSIPGNYPPEVYSYFISGSVDISTQFKSDINTILPISSFKIYQVQGLGVSFGYLPDLKRDNNSHQFRLQNLFSNKQRQVDLKNDSYEFSPLHNLKIDHTANHDLTSYSEDTADLISYITLSNRRQPILYKLAAFGGEVYNFISNDNLPVTVPDSIDLRIYFIHKHSNNETTNHYIDRTCTTTKTPILYYNGNIYWISLDKTAKTVSLSVGNEPNNTTTLSSNTLLSGNNPLELNLGWRNIENATNGDTDEDLSDVLGLLDFFNVEHSL